MMRFVCELVAILVIHRPVRHGVVVPACPLSLLLPLPQVVGVDETVANGPLWRAVPVAIVANVLYEEIVPMARNISADG